MYFMFLIVLESSLCTELKLCRKHNCSGMALTTNPISHSGSLLLSLLIKIKKEEGGGLFVAISAW